MDLFSAANGWHKSAETDMWIGSFPETEAERLKIKADIELYWSLVQSNVQNQSNQNQNDQNQNDQKNESISFNYLSEYIFTGHDDLENEDNL